MRIETFSVVKLHKNKYDKDYIKGSPEPTPRLLVIGTFVDTAQCRVRYPNGMIQRVEYQDITEKSIFTKDHKDYPKLIREMYAAQIEINKDTTFKPFLQQHHPQLAIELCQMVEARNRKYKETKSAELKAPIIVPALKPEVKLIDTDAITLLKSIDDKLGTLINLWTGGR